MSSVRELMLGLTQTRLKEYLKSVGKEFYCRTVGCCYRGVHRALHLIVVQKVKGPNFTIFISYLCGGTNFYPFPR